MRRGCRCASSALAPAERAPAPAPRVVRPASAGATAIASQRPATSPRQQQHASSERRNRPGHGEAAVAGGGRGSGRLAPAQGQRRAGGGRGKGGQGGRQAIAPCSSLRQRRRRQLRRRESVGKRGDALDAELRDRAVLGPAGRTDQRHQAWPLPDTMMPPCAATRWCWADSSSTAWCAVRPAFLVWRDDRLPLGRQAPPARSRPARAAAPARRRPARRPRSGTGWSA